VNLSEFYAWSPITFITRTGVRHWSRNEEPQTKGRRAASGSRAAFCPPLNYNHISDTGFSNLNEQPAEQFIEDTTNTETFSHAQDNVTDQTQTEETSKTEALTTRPHENKRETHEDLYTNRNLIHTIVTLLHDIFAKLKETSKPQHRNHNETLHHYLSQQLHSLSQKVDQLQQSYSQDNKPLSLTYRKPDTRTCFICKKAGHIAKNCRHQSSRWQKHQQKRQNTSFRNKNFKPRSSYQTPQNNGSNTSNYNNSYNWQRTSLRSKPTSSQNTSTLLHQPNITKLECQNKEPKPLKNSPQEQDIEDKDNTTKWNKLNTQLSNFTR